MNAFLLGSLELLSLTGNFLHEVPTKALEKMENLFILYLNNNAIKEIQEDSFIDFGKNLTDLWLHNNGFVYFIKGHFISNGNFVFLRAKMEFCIYF